MEEAESWLGSIFKNPGRVIEASNTLHIMSTNSIPGITHPTRPSPTTNTRSSRLPAPALFVGPPSRNTSQISVARPGTGDRTTSTRPDAARQKSTRARGFTSGNKDDVPEDLPALKKPSEKIVEAKWREMQSTLNEVEMTAQSSTHVFGEKPYQSFG